MFDLDKWEEIWLTMKKHKLRTALTAFGVFWGIFMLVVLLGAGNGLHNGVMQNFDIAKNAVFVWTEQTSMPFAGFEGGRPIDLTNDDFEALKKVDELKVISPRNRINARFSGQSIPIVRGNKTVSFTIMGDYPTFLDIRPLIMDNGRFINYIDIKEQRKIACIGKFVRDQLFEAEENAVGEYIKINDVPFKVVGVFNTRTQGEDALQDLQIIHIPHTTAQQTFNMPNEIHWFGFVPQDGVSGLEAEEIIKDIFRKRHKIHPEDQAALGSFNVEKEFLEMQGVFSGIAAFSWLVAIGTILAGMIGVGNIMLIIVKERTKEIGIRKSIGAKPWSIISMIVLESLVITGVAGYVGLLMGVGVIEGVSFAIEEFGLQSDYFRFPEIDFRVAITAIIVLLIAGVAAGLFPGIKAARINPVVALRDE